MHPQNTKCQRKSRKMCNHKRCDKHKIIIVFFVFYPIVQTSEFWLSKTWPQSSLDCIGGQKIPCLHSTPLVFLPLVSSSHHQGNFSMNKLNSLLSLLLSYNSLIWILVCTSKHLVASFINSPELGATSFSLEILKNPIPDNHISSAKWELW